MMVLLADGTTGFVYAWTATINRWEKENRRSKKVIEAERVDHEIRFIKP